MTKKAMTKKSLTEINDEQEQLLLAALKDAGLDDEKASLLAEEIDLTNIKDKKSACLEMSFDIAREIGRLTDAISIDDKIAVQKSLSVILADVEHIAHCVDLHFEDLVAALRANN